MSLQQFRNVLAFFAHPDDETLAAGATIAKLARAGARIHVAIPATGISSRRNTTSAAERDAALAELRKDCERACAVLGVPAANIHLGQFADNEMDSGTRLDLIHWLESLVAEIGPDLILTHHRYCTNIDHQYCHEAAVVATRPGLNSHIAVLCGEVPSSTGYLRPAQWEPNLYVEVSEQDVETKIRAMQAYQGESRPDPHPRSPEVLKALAKVRGSESGYMWGEAFMVQRIFG